MSVNSIAERQKELKMILGKYSANTVFIHSDLFRSSLFIKPSMNRETVINNQLNFLGTILEGRDLWFPAFNYQFPNTKTFNVKTSICEVGPLPEYFRQHKAQWRTLDPIFSASGTGENPFLSVPRDKIVAFDNNSAFAHLVKNKGSLLFYGAGFTSATILHYAEQIVTPLYRYDKTFNGTIIIDCHQYSVDYTYHVRPFGCNLDYAWDKLLKDLQTEGIAYSLKNNIATIISSDALVTYWLEQLNEDPFYFLNEQSKKWVIPKIDQLGRRFQLEDFE